MIDRTRIKAALNTPQYAAIRDEIIEQMLEYASVAADAKTEIEVTKGGMMAAGIGKLIRRLDGIRIESTKAAT